MFTFLFIFLSTFFISLVAFVGLVGLVVKENLLNKILSSLVALSAGTLIGAAFLDLIPEAVMQSTTSAVFSFVLIGFVFFFFTEKLLYWRHCHEGQCPVHTFAYLNLLGDGIHNFIDGLVIAASFIADTHLGLITTLAIFLHEVPQEIGDFGVLIYAGIEKKKALFFNFLTALTAILGGTIGYFLFSFVRAQTSFLIPFAAGGFIYIAASDLIPEMRKETDKKESFLTLTVFLLGILTMCLLNYL